MPIAMPMALIAEIMLITLCDFLAKRYLPAMNGASLIFVIERFFADAQNNRMLVILNEVKDPSAISSTIPRYVLHSQASCQGRR